ncbi:MAG TPA: phage tail protein [Phycisphaerae bacterium]|nr:phage tail protein [Phycisphaerae bacterium]
MAQEAPLIGGVVGAIIGTYFGEPALGWMIGSAIGGLFVPKPITHSLTDLNVQTSSYGVGVPQIFGTQRVSGNIIWASERVWVSTSGGGKGGKGGGGGGKGGGGQGSGYYTVNLAIAICEGPIMGLKSIWAGGTLIYADSQSVIVPSRATGGKKGGQTGPSYQTYTQSGNPITSSGGSSVGSWTLYHGTPEQGADPTVNQGIDYNGIAYIVFNTMYLGPSGQIPPLTFEIVEPVDAGNISKPAIVNSFPDTVVVNGRTQALAQYMIVDSSGNPIFPTEGNQGDNQWIKTNPSGTPIQVGPVLEGYWGQGYGNWGFAQGFGYSFAVLPGAPTPSNPYGKWFEWIDPDTGRPSSEGFIGAGDGRGLFVDSTYVYVWQGGDNYNATTGNWNSYGVLAISYTSMAIETKGLKDVPGGAAIGIRDNGFLGCNGIFFSSSNALVWNVATGNQQLIDITAAPFNQPSGSSFLGAATDGATQIWTAYSVQGGSVLVPLEIIVQQDATGPIADVGTPIPLSVSIGYMTYAQGNIWASDKTNLYQIDPSTGEILCTIAGVDADYLSFDGTYLWAHAGSTWYRIAMGGVLAPAAITLPEVCTILCERAGVLNYDVSRLPPTAVNFTRADTTDARSVLKALSTAYIFDMVDSAGTLVFVPHGTASVAIIPLSDLGYGPDTPTAQPPYAATRQQGIDLPRSVRIRYRSAALNWNKYEQIFALESYHEGREVVLDLPLTLDDQTAYNIASLACTIPHAERMQYAFTTPLKWLALEPGDVVTLPFGVCRILTVRMKRSSNAYLEFTACIDGLNALAGAGYAVPALPNYQPNGAVSYAPVVPDGSLLTVPVVGGAGPHPVQTAPQITQAVSAPGTAKLVFVEPPPVDSLDTAKRFYVGAYTTGNSFPGVGIYVSTDGGSSYSLLSTEPAASVVGYASTVLGLPTPTDAFYTWDQINSLNVYVQPAGAQLSSLPDINVLAGGNMAMVGDELIQFASAVLKTDSLGNSYYALSRLLRGRRGTEWAMGNHAVNDSVVFFPSNLTEEPYTNAMLNVPRLYKVVFMGQSYASVPSQSYEPSGASLEPWAVCHAKAVLDNANQKDWVISWTPRSRTNGDWASGYIPTLDSDAAGWSIDVMSGTTVVRTVNLPVGSTPAYWTWTYTGAMQNADGFAAGGPISLNLYPLSTAIGRGLVRSLTT